MNYLKAVMQKNEQLKIDELKNIISIGEKINKDVRPDKKKLEIILERQNKATSNTEEIYKQLKPTINKNELIGTRNERNKPDPETNIDTQNSIRSIDANDDKIIVKFNKNYTKQDISQISKKNGLNYEYTFNITGKYKYTTSSKPNIDNIDNIMVSDNKNSVGIVISNKSNPKITYTLASRELVINIISNSIPTSTIINSKKKEELIKDNVPEALPPSISAQMTTGTQKGRKKTIVLDAGHGGDDVGAVGPDKRYEKVINLNVTKYLASILKQRGYTVYLTRNADFFIKVIDRTVLANEKNADLFMSIHTNAVPLEKANEVAGIETFFLSPAREERAKRVAALENKSDIREMSESSKDVFLESLNRPRITASHKFAIDVQAGILQSARSKYKDIQDSGVREGPFWVLVGAQMPSILVELGYISHTLEGKRLYDKNYQQLLANGIANGVDSYFSKNP